MMLNFSKDYSLENERVKLYPLRLKHKDELITVSKDRDIWLYFFERGDTEESLERYIKSTINNRKSAKEYPFVVFDKLKNKYAGTTRFYEYSSELKVIKLGHTWYGKEFRGSGLNKHCKYLLFQFAFEKLQVERVGFGSYKENKISIAALQSVGCKKEGVLRNFFPTLDGKKRTDAILLSILKGEWYEYCKSQLKNKLQ